MERSREDWELLVIVSSLAFKDWGASEGLLGRGLMWSACHLKSLTGIAVLAWEHCGYTCRSRVTASVRGRRRWGFGWDLVGMTRVKSGQTEQIWKVGSTWSPDGLDTACTVEQCETPHLASRRTSFSVLFYVSDFVVFSTRSFPAFASLSQLLALLFPQASPLLAFSLSFPVMTSRLSWAQSLQLCPNLCDPMDCRPSDSSVHEILQARTLEWVAMPSSRGFSQFRDWTLVFCVSCIALEVECIQIPISSANLYWALMLCFQLFISRFLLKPQSSLQSSRFETLCPYCTAAAAAKSLQSCPTLCDPIDSSPPGSSVSGILQARTLEWVAISFSNAWKWKVKVKLLSHVRLLATPWTAAHQAPLSMGFSRQEYWSGVPLPSPLIAVVPMKQC